MSMKNNNENSHNYPFDSTQSSFSQFEEIILPKIVWITFIIALILTLILLFLNFNPLFAMITLILWFIFSISAEMYLMRK